MTLRGDYSDDLDGVYTFWGAIDSGSFYGWPSCDCLTVDPNRHQESCLIEGPSWELVRNSKCLATMSTRLRCHRDTMTGIPFCQFHLARLEGWLMVRLERHVKALARRELGASKRVYLRDSLERALVEDAEQIVAKSKTQIYFLGIDAEIVKIGYSIHPLARVSQIRQGSSVCPEGYDRKRAELIGTIPGGQATEAQLHSVLRPHRITGEWFHLHDDVQKVIQFLLTGENERVANRVFLDAAVRPWWVDEGYGSESDALELGQSA